MRKFLTLLKTLTAFRNLHVRKHLQADNMHVVCCNTATVSVRNFTVIPFALYHNENGPVGSGSFFLRPAGNNSSTHSAPVFSVIKNDQHKQQNKKFEHRIISISQTSKRQHKYFLTLNPEIMKTILHRYQSWVFALLFALLVLMVSGLGQ
ncbi:MAG: hypothetical protein LC128_11525 [Chitinophagales bacterium]|nr:hypothetical protein [Chitinophagales bacterium]